jgi:NAD(P)-dependent dehydrogenase (short-subunit alcohol dehydrogenase family)
MANAPIFDLTGRTALITGASSGIGERWARILGAAGAKVVLAARRTDRLEAVKAEIIAAGGQALAVAMNVADEASTKAAYDAAEAAFGVVDTVVANAGMNSEGPAVDLPVDEFDRLMSVNLRGAFLTVREGARRLIADGAKEKEHGRIVINASITANAVEPGLAAYAASKAGVQHMGKVLARDWARFGINVNVICPGYIKTDISGDWFLTPGGEKQINGFPRRRLMAESDLDTALLYLCSDASRCVTGSSFTIDDGQSL